MNPGLLAEMLAQLASGIPSLPQAACREHVDLFDAVERHTTAAAIEICSSCADLEACRDWASAQPPKNLTGVVAGLDRSIYRSTPTRRNP